jgi:hypothetical protein
MAVNALVTALIVYKIVSVYNDIRGFNLQTNTHGNGRRDLGPLISILIESGFITFAGQLTQSIMYKYATFAFPLVGGSVVMLYVRSFCRLLICCRIYIYLLQGISTTVVLVRVEMGVSYDNNTSNTANSTNTGRPIQLTPFATKLNQTSIIDIAVSDDPHDLHSERKIMRPN